MIDSREALDVLDMLYGTLDDPDRWHDWLDALCNALCADGANIAVVPRERPEASLLLDNYCSEAELQTYQQHYVQLDWQRARLDGLPVGAVATTSQLSAAALQEYFDSRYFQEFAKNTPHYMSMGGYFHRDHSIVGTTGIHRRDMNRPFLPHEVEFVRQLHAHIARVVRLHGHLVLLEQAARGGPSGDTLLLLDEDGRVRYTNPAGEALLEGNDVMQRKGRLTASRRDDDEVLQAAIRAAAQHLHWSTDLFLNREAGRLPLIVSVSRAEGTTRTSQHVGAARVMVTIQDPQRLPLLKRRVLESLYGFTPRELELSELLASGLPLRRIAEHLNIAYETARTYVKSMAAKAGVRGQTQLVAFLVRLSE